MRKAVACVLRMTVCGAGAEPLLLVFDHPIAGAQIPKGTIEADESPEAAVYRELVEESGVTSVVIVNLAGALTREVGAGADESGPIEIHRWHLFHLRPTRELPDSWDHQARGSVEETGLLFRFRWVPLAEAVAQLHPAFHPTCRALSDYRQTLV